jgi:hypothetical protein
MKALKIVAIAAATVVVLVAVLLVLALTPGIQTWAIRKAVAGQPGLVVEVGHVAVGLSSARISDLRVVQNGAVLTAASISADYSAWDYLLHNDVNVDQVAITGLTVDLRSSTATAAPPASASAPSAPASTPNSPPSAAADPSSPPPPDFNGILNLARLPLDVRVGAVAVEGRALLPGDREANFNLHGANVALGEKGKLEWKAGFTDPRPAASVRTAQTSGTLALHLTADRRLDVVELEALASATGPNLPPDRLRLALKAEQAAAGGDEHYTVEAALMRPDKSEPLFASHAEYQASTHQLTGTWNLTVQGDRVAAVLAGLGLPRVALDGAGKFTLEPGRSSAAGSGEIHARISQLEKLSPALTAMGAIQLQAGFGGSLAGDIAHLDRLEIDATAADGRKFVELAAHQKISFDLHRQRLALADPKAELARLSLTGVPLAWAQPAAKPLIIDSGELSLVLAIEADGSGDHIRVRTVAPVTLRNVIVRDGEKKIADRITFAVSPNLDYTAEKIVAELADLTVSTPAGDTVSGKASAQITNWKAVPSVAFSTQIEARLVSVLRPCLPLDPGPLSASTAIEGRLDGQTLKIAKESTRVEHTGGALLVSAEVLQPLTVDLNTASVTATKPATPAARLKFGEIPLAWAQAFVPKSEFAGTFGGAVFEVSVRGADDLALQSVEPATVRGFGVTLDGRELARGLDVALDVEAAKQGPAIAYNVRQLEVKQAAASLLKLNVAGKATPGATLAATAKGRLDADLPALLRQPALRSLTTLARGRATASFDINVTDTIAARATLAVHDLVALPDNRALGDLDATVDAVMKSGGASSLKLPLTLTVAGRRSDLLIDGGFTQTKSSLSFNGKVTSDQIVADDFQALAALAPSSSAPAPAEKPAAPSPAAAKTPAPAAAPVADAAPFWAGVTGKFEMNLKRIQYGKDYTISDVLAAAVVDDNRLALDRLEGKFKENPFKVAAAIAFDARQPRPYTLKGTASVTGFDVGAFLRAANPDEPPALESKVSVNAKLAGTGLTLPNLAQNATGQFDVTGSAGVLRALGRKGGAVGKIAKVVGLFGALRGSDTTVAVADLAAELNEMKFDRFSVHAERGADLNLKLTALEFLSAATHITGTGSIEHQPGVALDLQPLHVEVQLAGKDQMATLLNKAGLLGAAKDDKGYSLMSQPFVVTGTLAKPDSSQLWKIAGEAAAKAAVGGLFH